jgi:hypothetical protein
LYSPLTGNWRVERWNPLGPCRAGDPNLSPSAPSGARLSRRDFMAWAAAPRLITPADTASAHVPAAVMKGDFREANRQVRLWATAHRLRYAKALRNKMPMTCI